MKIDNGEIKVNDKIKLGIKYHNKFFGNIPRKEIDKIYKMITVIIKKLNKQYKLTDENKYIFEICGSYRREKDTSGDIDILITKSLHGLVSSVKANTLYVCIEGYMTDPDYGADISPEVIQEGMKGFSAGKFIVSGRDLRDNLFINVKELCNYEKNYYTIEQPFFNRAIMGMTNIDMDLLNSPLISINGESYNKDSTILIDCAGEPGNGEFHYSKILDVFCLLNCEAL
jgi:hypothetical protein